MVGATACLGLTAVFIVSVCVRSACLRDFLNPIPDQLMKPSFTLFLRTASISLFSLALLGGCATSKPSLEQQISAAMLPDKSEVTTALPPQSAIERAGHVFAQLSFSVQETDLERFNLHPGSAGDYFFASVAATGANDTRTLTVAQWISEGNTVVKFSSNLDKAEHDHVVMLLQQALAEPAKAQASGQSPAQGLASPKAQG